VKRILQSPTIWIMLVHGISGVGFAAANLLLARVLPTTGYARFTLVIALINLGFALAPMGIDGVVNRRRIAAGPGLLVRLLAPSLLVAGALTLVGAAGYGIPRPELGMLFVATAAGGAMTVAGAQFQSEQRFQLALGLTQSPNLVLLVAAVVVLASRIYAAWLPLLISAGGFVAAAAYGWGRVLRERGHKPAPSDRLSWGEALSIAGLSAAGLLLVQLERLVIPKVLPLAALATYGVLGATVGSLFRVLQMGAAYSLLPRLAGAPGVPERRRLLQQELLLVILIVALGVVFLWLVLPLVERYLLSGKYHLGVPLVIAAMVSGVTKVLSSLFEAGSKALAAPRELSFLTLFGWGAVGVAIAGATAGGVRWGLVGVIYGVAAGWLLRAIAAGAITARHLRLPAPVPVTVA
jgi:O-antigen/teichoic acid export membrane protein